MYIRFMGVTISPPSPGLKLELKVLETSNFAKEYTLYI